MYEPKDDNVIILMYLKLFPSYKFPIVLYLVMKLGRNLIQPWLHLIRLFKLLCHAVSN